MEPQILNFAFYLDASRSLGGRDRHSAGPSLALVCQQPPNMPLLRTGRLPFASVSTQQHANISTQQGNQTEAKPPPQQQQSRQDGVSALDGIKALRNGRFKLSSRVATGRFSEFWIASDSRTGEEVVLKVRGSAGRMKSGRLGLR